MKKMFTCTINEEILEKTRDIVYWSPGLTMSSLIEELLKDWNNETERTIKKFPKRESPLKRGRFKQ